MEFDEVFQYIGDIGVYQIILYLLLGIPSFYSGYQSIAMVFLGPSQEHWCEVSGLTEYPYDTQKYVGVPYNAEDEEYEQCTYYDLSYDNYTVDEIYDWNWTTNGMENVSTATCDSWVFDQSIFTETAVTEFNLVCDDDILVSLVSSIYLGGILVGAPLSGALSDRFGRKIVLIGGSLFHFVFGIAAAFAPNYATFVTLRFFLSVANSFSYLCSFVIIMEVIGPAYRTLAGVVFQIWFAFGFMILPAMSYFIRDFRLLQIAMACPVIVSVAFIFLVPESPRWLVAQERYEDAEKILHNIAEVNGKELPKDLDLQPEKEEEEVEKGSFWDLFRYPVLRREILIIYLAWLTSSLVYYGLSLNTGSLVGSVFLNTFISGSVEIPANIICIFTMYYVGRRPTLAWSFIVAGVSAFLCIPLLGNEDLSWLLTTFTMIGKAAITICFSAVYVYTAELFPTPVRHLAVGSSSMMSRVAGLVAPFMGEPLMEVWTPLPSVIFGVFGVMSGLFTFLLPETLNQKMPDTIQDAENIGRLTSSLVYYGLSLNTGSLVGSVFLNTFISGSVEIPANIICIFTMYYVGCRPTLAWSFIVAGVSAFLCIPLLGNDDLSWLLTTFTMIGKAAITICFSAVYTAELFPTPVRHLAVGSSSMMSRVAGLVAPFMGEPLMEVWTPLPSVIFGVFGVMSGLFTFLLPETLNQKMPDTIQDAENIGRLSKKPKSQAGDSNLTSEVSPTKTSYDMSGHDNPGMTHDGESYVSVSDLATEL